MKTLLHAPEPIQTQLAGNTLQSDWIGHCTCGWRGPADHLDYQHALLVSMEHIALLVSMEHIARCPEMWPEPPEAAA